MRTTPLNFGEPAPWFTACTDVNPQFQFHTLAGRYVALCFFHSAADRRSQRVLADIVAHSHHFDVRNACFFGVSTDREDKRCGRVHDVEPGIRHFWDFDQQICQLYGVLSPQSQTELSCCRLTYVLDERLRVVATLSFDAEPETHIDRLVHLLKRLPVIGEPTHAAIQAPILVVPRVFEPEFCHRLIDLYNEHGGFDSGFMREVDGKTVAIVDHSYKRRRDYEIEDETLRNACMARIHDRLVPEISKAFQFTATRMERYFIACYDAAWRGQFRPHRDNTTKGTNHRRFAVSLMLNSDYEGGHLRFPEFGPQLYTAPTGGAVVFSCSLLHEAKEVKKGRRYVFLPFVYDDEAAKIRHENQKFLAPNP